MTSHCHDVEDVGNDVMNAASHWRNCHWNVMVVIVVVVVRHQPHADEFFWQFPWRGVGGGV